MSAAASRIAAWRRDIVLFVREVIGAEPDPWQIKVLRDVVAHGKIALKACKGPGKTCLLAWVVLWFLACFPHSKALATSITSDNLSDNLWAELSLWQKKSPLLTEAFEWSATAIRQREHPETWFASARAWPRTADANSQANTLAGLHGRFTLVVVDEVGDIPEGVVSAGEGSLSTGEVNKILIAGNPTSTDGPLWNASTRDRAHWAVTEITGDPADPMRAPRISVAWANEQIERYGRDNPWVLVNVFGQFPPVQSDKLLGPEDVSRAERRAAREGSFEQYPVIFGVDCARFGADKSTIYKRQGPMLWRPVEHRNVTTTALGDQVIHFAVKHNPDAVFIDVGAMGAGIVDHCNAHGLKVIEVNFGGRALDEQHFENRRAEMWSSMAAWLRRDASIPVLPDLSADLTAPRYWFDRKQRVCLEPKDEIKKRIGRSTDDGDAVALTFAAPVVAKSHPLSPHFQRAGGAVEWKYDPYRRDEA